MWISLFSIVIWPVAFTASPCMVWSNWKYLLQFLRSYFSCIAVVILLRSLCLFQKNLLNYVCPNHFPQPQEVTTCENCCTQTTQKNMAPHNKRWSIVTVFCTQCSNFSTTFQIDFIYREAKKHSRVQAKNILNCNFRFKDFPGFHSKDLILVSVDFDQDIYFGRGYSFRKYRWHRTERRI